MFARVKKAEDAPYVRDEILKAFAEARRGRAAGAARGRREVGRPLRLRCARSTTPSRSPATLARFVRYRRSYDTLNELYRDLRRR